MEFNGAQRSAITGVPGWETEQEQHYLAGLAMAVPEDGVIVEIGAEFGMSASLFAYGSLPSVLIYSVDLFPGNLLQVHRESLRAKGFGGQTMQIIGDSKHVGKRWPMDAHNTYLAQMTNFSNPPAHPDYFIDLLFVDGDHSEAGAYADIVAWLPHVKGGGIIAFHDVAQETNADPHELHVEVRRAIENAIRNGHPLAYVHSVDTIRAYRKTTLVAPSTSHFINGDADTPTVV